MAFDSSGNFSLTYTWATEALSPPISIAKLDTEMANIAAGLSLAVLRNGNGKPTVEQDFNGQKLSNLAASTTGAGAPTTTQVQNSATTTLASVAGADTITGTLAPDLTALTAGQRFSFEPAADNTGAVTLNVDSLGAKDVLKWSGVALTAGDLKSGVPAHVIYDGTQFILTNPLAHVSDFGAADKAGYRNIPQNAQTGNYTCVLADAGKHVMHASGAGAGDTYTIPANSSVAYPIGTVLTFTNLDTNAVSIAITTDTLYYAGTGATGTRSLAQYGLATALKVGTTTWVISGAGLS